MTGRIDYSPDYKSEKNVDVRISRATGGAYADPREVIEDEMEQIRRDYADYVERNEAKWCRESERARLEREVIEAAIEEYKVEREADRGANTITRTGALIKLQPLMQRRREAVATLIELESSQEKKG